MARWPRTIIDGLELEPRITPTNSSPALVRDIHPGTVPGNLFSLGSANGVLYFSANDESHGYELWRSDGTSTGTSLVKDTVPGIDSSGIGNLTSANGVLYYNGGSNLI